MSLQEKYIKEIRPALQEKLGLKNVNQVPRLEKVVLNVGIGSFMQNNKDYSLIEKNLSLITGQKVFIRRARMSVSNFKLREGSVNGLSVTLRGSHMYHFINKLVDITLPRVRDFRGINPKSFDGRGNYSLGIKEHIVFPEADVEDEIKPFGLEITVVTSTDNDDQAYELLKALGFPFKKVTK